MPEYSQTYKEKKIESIEKEVEELHPLLNDLFKKMKGIEYYECTHGPDEYGADFILQIKQEYYQKKIIMLELL